MEVGLSRWQIETSGRVVELSQDELRAQLRDGTLSGLEPARAPGEAAWRPLHTLPLFAETLPVVGDGARLAHQRAVRRWGTHLVIFSGICFALWVGAGHFPVCGLYWLIPLSLHTLRTVPSLAVLLRPAPPPRVEPELDRLIAALQAATADLDGLRSEAEALTRRIAAEPSARVAEALEQQRAALQDRIALMAEARIARDRLVALRERHLHQQAAIALDQLADAATALDRIRPSA